MQIKISLLLLVFVFMGETVTMAQIPNPSFENWNGDVPVGWGSTALSLPGLVLQSYTPYAGSYAISLNVVPQGSIYVGGSLFSVSIASSYFPVTAVPVALHGWYISNAVSGDELFIAATAITTSRDSSTGSGFIDLTNSTPVYKEFVVNFNYFTNAADSVSLEFEINNDTAIEEHSGTYFIIDDLYFGPPAGINNIPQTNISLEQNYPNPAIDNTNIIYTVQQASAVKLEIIDMLGRTVQTLVNTTQTPGRYKAIADVSTLATGNYLYRLTEDGNVICKMMAVGR